MPLRRLEAEELRDALIFTAGELDETKYGQPVAVEVRKDGLVTAKRSEDGWRRSVYVRHRRKEMPTFLEVFDLPQMNPNCTERKISNVVSQPLLLVNNKMVHELAVYFADRVRKQAGDDPAQQIKLAYQLAYQRPPTETELALALKSLKLLNPPAGNDSQEGSRPADGFTEYCHVLLNSAEFLYID